MGSLANLINGFLKPVGIELVRLPRRQVMPAELPDPALYTGPEDYHRLFRPWRGAEFDRWFTPAVTDNTMLSRQKLYFLLRMVQQTLGVPGDIFEAGAGSGLWLRVTLSALSPQLAMVSSSYGELYGTSGERASHTVCSCCCMDW